MRRTDRQVTDLTEIAAILNRCDTIRLGLQGEEYPYVVPLSFGWEMVDGTIYIYFHGAKEGHKLDAIKADNRVSFTVVDQGVQVEGKQGPDVRSVIVFGRVTLMETTSEALEIARRLGEKYDPADFVADELVRTEKRLQMLELVVDHMTGKRVNES